MRGACLCGAIRFRVEGTAQGFSACHCTQCRRQSGHFWASAYAGDDALVIEGEPSWYRASDKARRGFCPTCGSFLFWKHAEDEHTSFALGALEAPTGVALSRHIFTAEKGDYYTIDDGLPCT